MSGKGLRCIPWGQHNTNLFFHPYLFFSLRQTKYFIHSSCCDDACQAKQRSFHSMPFHSIDPSTHRTLRGRVKKAFLQPRQPIRSFFFFFFFCHSFLSTNHVHDRTRQDRTRNGMAWHGMASNQTRIVSTNALLFCDVEPLGPSMK